MDEMIRALKEAYDLSTCKDVVQHGCVSGVCHKHIYYGQTSSKRSPMRLKNVFTDFSVRSGII